MTIKSLTNCEEYKKYFKDFYHGSQYDLDKIIDEIFEIRQELFRLRFKK